MSKVDYIAVEKALLTPETPNVMTAQAGAVVCGGTIWMPACDDLVRLCQGVIDGVYEHRHLRDALVLLLLRDKQSDAEAGRLGKRVIAGKAAKATPQLRLLSRVGRGQSCPADFVVWLNQVWLAEWGAVGKDSDGVWQLTRDPETLQKVFALIDHELCHCAAKIVGKFVPPAEVEGYVEELGPRHISTERDLCDEKGRILVRLYKKPDVGEYTWCMRKHDLEEFNGVIARHGAWSKNLETLIDELATDEAPLFDSAGAL